MKSLQPYLSRVACSSSHLVSGLTYVEYSRLIECLFQGMSVALAEASYAPLKSLTIRVVALAYEGVILEM